VTTTERETTLAGRLTQHPVWSIFRIAAIGLLMLSLVAACGSDDGDDDDSSNETTNATMSTDSTGGANATMSTDSDDSTPAGDMGDAMAIGACFQANTTSDIVTDLRDGNTDSAEDMYRECLGDALPESMVSQLDPVIEQAGTCGTEASADLSDDDIAAIEDGDQTTINQVTTDTLDCLSAELGIPLQ
jgi:hypothetical protein